ncbi:hypothetical protein pb186bvf_015230 [Paramecium bursaria]
MVQEQFLILLFKFSHNFLDENKRIENNIFKSSLRIQNKKELTFRLENQLQKKREIEQRLNSLNKKVDQTIA